MHDLITVILTVAGTYVAIGITFAIAFAARGVDSIDPNAKGAGIGFRILIMPGSAAFWPLLLRRWLRKLPPPTERNAHRDAAKETRR